MRVSNSVSGASLPAKLTCLARNLCLILSCGAVFGLTTGTALARPKSWYAPRPRDHKPLVMAHQGGEGEYPSNTQIAFDAAVKAGADVLDTDFHMTKDGVLVLAHDETLDYRTNGSGAIRDKTWAELQDVDFGYNWSPDGGQTYPWRGKGVGPMNMDQFMSRYRRKRLSIEIKQVAPEAVYEFCLTIKYYNADHRVLVSSFDQANMDLFRQICPGVATSATTAEATKFFLLYKQGQANSYVDPPFSSLQLPEYQSGIQVLTPDFVQAIHNHPSHLKVMAWTIDTTADWQRLAAMGVDGINTSYPQRIADFLAKK